jgi:1-deoxy-D-xylulose-5-phosphate reductoisomerase
MRVPILYALTYPNRFSTDLPRLDFSNYHELTFIEPDMKKFRNLSLAYEALKAGGNMPCILNAANEIAVKAFLKEEIRFTQMPDVVEYTLGKSSYARTPDLDSLESYDFSAREIASDYLNKIHK